MIPWFSITLKRKVLSNYHDQNIPYKLLLFVFLDFSTTYTTTCIFLYKKNSDPTWKCHPHKPVARDMLWSGKWDNGRWGWRESELGGQEHWILIQRTQVLFLAPAWQLMTIINFRGSDSFSSSVRTQVTQAVCSRQACRQNTHTHKWKTEQINQWMK